MQNKKQGTPMTEIIEGIGKSAQQLRDENDVLKAQLDLIQRLNKEREISNSLYAIKSIEKGFVGLLIIFALVSLYFIFERTGLPHP